MEHPDIRWRQRFSNFRKALAQLAEAVELSSQRPLSKLEQQGLIHTFEFVHELAWNVIKDYFEYQGNTSITDSRDATREAFRCNLIFDGEGWMEMIVNRNKFVHTYNEETAAEIAEKVPTHYFRLFQNFNVRIQELIDADR